MSSYEYNFQDRMAQGKDLAQVARNKGQHTGKSAKGWTGIKRQPMSAIDYLYMETYKLETAYAHYKEWQYAAVAAVESALFAYDLEETF